MNLSYIEEMLEKQEYKAAVSHFSEAYQKMAAENSLTAFKSFIRCGSNEKEMKELLIAAEESLMDQLSSIMIRDMYRTAPSPQTAIWYSEQLADEHKLIEAEELLVQVEKQELTEELREKLSFSMATVLMQMRRLGAAYEYMKKCEALAKDGMNTRWGYYYLQSGDWDKAVSLLEAGKKDKKDGVIARLLLVQHWALQGEAERAQRELDEAIALYPDYPKLLIEKIRLCSKQKKWKEMRETIQRLNELSPYRDYKKMTEYYTAESHYGEEDFDVLESYLNKHSHFKEKSYFKHFKKEGSFKKKNTAYKPVVQKYNYCVPACAEMVFSMYGKTVKQDEIAESIFAVNGSKLSKMIAYFKEKEFRCTYFFGNEEVFKELLDRDIAIMVNIDYPTASHVQLIVGYDDRLQVFHVQDPNNRYTHELMYEDLQREFGNNGALSLAISPMGHSDLSGLLPDHVHEMSEKLFALTEIFHKELSREDQDFLKENIGHMAVSAYIMKYLPGVVDEEILNAAAEVILKHKEQAEYHSLTAAMAYYSAKNNEQAESYLKSTKSSHYPGVYWLIKGRISYGSGKYDEAYAAFKEALKKEPEDHVLWTYLSMSAFSRNHLAEGLKYSEIAMDINSLDLFTIVNHGILLLEADRPKEARDLLHECLRENKDDGYVWLQRARCDLAIGKYRAALRGFRTAAALDPAEAEAFIELADLYDSVFKDEEKALGVLEQGIQTADDKTELLHAAGGIRENREEYQQARELYSMAAALDEKDAFSRIALAALYKEEGDTARFFKEIQSHYEAFQHDSEFLFNAGKRMFAASSEMDESEAFEELALSYMEKAISFADENVEEAMEIYTGLIAETPYYRRGLAFFERLKEKVSESAILAYSGYLHEQQGSLFKARKLYRQAAEICDEKVFTFYRLGEAAFKLEEYAEAERHYKKVLELDPKHEQAMLDLASVANRREDKTAEKDYLLSAFHVDPYCISAEVLLDLMETKAEAESFKQDLLKLEGTVEEAFLHHSLSHVYAKLGEAEKEEQHLMQALELDPDQLQVQHHYAAFLISRGKAKEAKALLYKLIHDHPGTRKLYDTLIDLMIETKTIQKLEGELKKWKVSNEEKSIIFMHAALSYERHLNDMQEAFEDAEKQRGWLKRITGFSKASLKFGLLIHFYEEAVKLDRENGTAVNWFADCYLQLGLNEDAIKVLQQSLRHAFDPAAAYKLAGLLIQEAAIAGEKKAVRFLSEACGLLEALIEDEEDADYYTLLGMALLEFGDFEEAEDAFKRALEIDPEVEKGHFHLARLYTEAEKYRQAEANIRQAMMISPDDHDNYNQLGLIYRHEFKLKEALEAVEAAIALQPEDLLCLYNRACYLASMKRFEEAAEQLEALYELDEDFIFTEMAEEDEDLEPLKEAGYFPVNKAAGR
ncbi:tetratricopeptide repeat protein [Metabacillus sp. JX24]|uniref:tetratricopeptide repeat protein n=1 Tax=Metabacillus sp. JX24 TaxID=3240759 RepID=UPI00350E9BDD